MQLGYYTGNVRTSSAQDTLYRINICREEVECVDQLMNASHRMMSYYTTGLRGQYPLL